MPRPKDGTKCEVKAPEAPAEAVDAIDDKAGGVSETKGGSLQEEKSTFASEKVEPAAHTAQAKALEEAHEEAQPFCEECEKEKSEAEAQEDEEAEQTGYVDPSDDEDEAAEEEHESAGYVEMKEEDDDEPTGYVEPQE